MAGHRPAQCDGAPGKLDAAEVTRDGAYAEPGEQQAEHRERRLDDVRDLEQQQRPERQGDAERSSEVVGIEAGNRVAQQRLAGCRAADARGRGRHCRQPMELMSARLLQAGQSHIHSRNCSKNAALWALAHTPRSQGSSVACRASIPKNTRAARRRPPARWTCNQRSAYSSPSKCRIRTSSRASLGRKTTPLTATSGTARGVDRKPSPRARAGNHAATPGSFLRGPLTG